MSKKFIKIFLEYIPLIIFFTVFKMSGNSKPIIDATLYLVISSIVCVALSYILLKKIPMVTIVSTVIIAIFGTISVVLDNEDFIKLKPTIVNILFAGILLISNYSNKLPIKLLLGESIEMPDESWRRFSNRWILYFLFLGVLNEIVWRNFDTATWVNFKIFGLLGLSMIFTMLQTPFLKREGKFLKIHEE